VRVLDRPHQHPSGSITLLAGKKVSSFSCPLHEGIQGGGGLDSLYSCIAPLIVNLGTTWKWSVSRPGRFTPRKEPVFPFIRRWDSGAFGLSLSLDFRLLDYFLEVELHSFINVGSCGGVPGCMRLVTFTTRRGKSPTPVEKEAGWAKEPVWTLFFWGGDMYIYISYCCRDSNYDSSVVQPVPRRKLT
jgi:hypothetical protein